MSNQVDFLTASHFNFLQDIHQAFPTFIGGVVADRHGLVVASEKGAADFDEEILAVSSVTNRNFEEYFIRMGFKKGSYVQVKLALENHLTLCLFLENHPLNLQCFKQLTKILQRRQV